MGNSRYNKNAAGNAVGPLILGYSFYTEQSGTVNFETQIQINIAEESQVQKVSLDKGALKF